MKTKETKKNDIMKRIIVATIIMIAITCTILLYSRFIGTQGLIIKEYKVENEKITDNFHGFKIVHISDVHYGTTIYKKELENIVAKVNQLKPDIVVLTGDLLDETTNIKTAEQELIDTLSKIEVTIGKFAITGNHDNQFQEWENIIKQSGFNNLNDTYDRIYKNGTNYILLSGVSTNMFENNDINTKLQSTKEFISTIPEEERCNIYKILLLHEPDFIDNITDIQYDLILAGHSHNGQIKFPLIGIVKTPIYSTKYYDEYYKVNNSDLYISGGIGTSKIKFRLFNKPSINFYRITHQ